MASVASYEYLVLDGSLTVRTIAAVHSKLSNVLQHHAAVAVDCAAATEIDLSFVQLLLAARKTAARAGKTLALARPASGALHDALLRTGLLPPVDGGPADEAAFWLKGADPT
jgi:ABC-type transporter Mla MlaB component